VWVALAAVGCKAQTPTHEDVVQPDFVQPITGAEGTHRRLLVYDPNDAVVGVATADSSAGPAANIWWEPVAGDPRALVVGWLGGLCAVDPTLEVVAADARLALRIHDGHREFSSDICADVATAYGVRLTLRRPVAGLQIFVALAEDFQ
jgi:hypothetical protein